MESKHAYDGSFNDGFCAECKEPQRSSVHVKSELLNLPEPFWFHHGENVLSLLEEHKPKLCVELGTYLGGSAIAMARVIARWGGALTTIDAFTHGTTIKMCFDNFEKYLVTGQVGIIQADTRTAAEEWPHGPIDFLYVDADHSYDGCLSDLRAWWPWLRVGGVICGDDYGRKEMNVTEAWDAFEKEVSQTFQRTLTPNVDGWLIHGVKQ